MWFLTGDISVNRVLHQLTGPKCPDSVTTKSSSAKATQHIEQHRNLSFSLSPLSMTGFPCLSMAENHTYTTQSYGEPTSGNKPQSPTLIFQFLRSFRRKTQAENLVYLLHSSCASQTSREKTGWKTWAQAPGEHPKCLSYALELLVLPRESSWWETGQHSLCS